MSHPGGPQLNNHEGGGPQTASFSLFAPISGRKCRVLTWLLMGTLTVLGTPLLFSLRAQENSGLPPPSAQPDPPAAPVVPVSAGETAPTAAAVPAAPLPPGPAAGPVASPATGLPLPSSSPAPAPAHTTKEEAPVSPVPAAGSGGPPEPAEDTEIILPDGSADPAENDPNRVRFTAWNLKNYLHAAAPPPPGSTEKAKPPRERAAIVTMLADIHPDILGVCEMGSAADLAVLQADLKKAGLDLPQTEWVEGADPSRHLALLTRFPIASRQPVTDQRYVLDDSQFPVQRGFLDVTVAVSGTYTLRLIGTHLKSRMDVPEADQELMRRNEAHLLRQHIDTVLTAGPQANLLVYGDFNDTRDQPSVKAIKGMRGAAAALTEIPATDDSGERWTFYYPEADEYSRIDFLLASPGLLPEVRKAQAFLPGGRGWSRASDHRPLTFDLTADDSAAPRSRKRSRSRSKTKSEAPATTDSSAEN